MVMRVGPDGMVNVIAVNGVNFKACDGGLAINAALLQPISIAVDDFGNVYIGECGGRIRKVSTYGIITTIAGTDASGFSGDNGPATRAQLYGPYGIAIGRDATIYFSDTQNNRIRKIAPNGIITTVAGTGVAGFSGDGTAATQARLNRGGNVTTCCEQEATRRKIDARYRASLHTPYSRGCRSISEGRPHPASGVGSNLPGFSPPQRGQNPNDQFHSLGVSSVTW
jgi:hypothetical protein